MTEGKGVFAVIWESKSQAPILMETEGDQSSIESAQARCENLLVRPDTIRACVVQIVYPERISRAGNQSLIEAMKGLQK